MKNNGLSDTEKEEMRRIAFESLLDKEEKILNDLEPLSLDIEEQLKTLYTLIEELEKLEHLRKCLVDEKNYEEIVKESKGKIESIVKTMKRIGFEQSKKDNKIKYKIKEIVGGQQPYTSHEKENKSEKYHPKGKSLLGTANEIIEELLEDRKIIQTKDLISALKEVEYQGKQFWQHNFKESSYNAVTTMAMQGLYNEREDVIYVKITSEKLNPIALTTIDYYKNNKDNMDLIPYIIKPSHEGTILIGEKTKITHSFDLDKD